MDKRLPRAGRAAAAAGIAHAHGDWALVHEYRSRPELLAMTHVWRAPGESGLRGRRQGRARGDRHAVPAGRSRSAPTLRHARRAHGRARPARAGVARARASPARPGPTIRTTSTFELLGLVALADPLRAGVPAAVQRVPRRRHPRGDDHRRLPGHGACHRPRRPGIDADDSVVTGDETRRAWTSRRWRARAAPATVFARILPEQKLRSSRR